MADAAVAFDGVWKKFRKGERHDSLRDLVPATVGRIFRRTRPCELQDQEFWALKDVSFQVHAGEALGIVGPNGAGKSTTLKLLTKILRPTLGRCEVRGRIGALIELAAGFHPDLTGRENIYLQGAVMGMRRPDVARRFDEIVAFAGVDGFIDTQVKRYSSGMQARLGFAIAAHLEPDVLLIDEVLSVGDYSFRQRCHLRLAQFRDDGVPIVFVSHDLQAVASLSQRVLLLRPAGPSVLGPTAEVLDAYRSPEVCLRDDRASIATVALCGDDSVKLESPVAPTTWLTLSVLVMIHKDLPRCCVGIDVVRDDGVVVFESSPMFDGVPAMQLDRLSCLEIVVRFRANLLKGVYSVGVHLGDEDRIWPAVRFHRLAHFTVHETTRVAGVAELEPQYTFTRHGSGDAHADGWPLVRAYHESD